MHSSLVCQKLEPVYGCFVISLFTLYFIKSFFFILFFCIIYLSKIQITRETIHILISDIFTCSLIFSVINSAYILKYVYLIIEIFKTIPNLKIFLFHN